MLSLPCLHRGDVSVQRTILLAWSVCVISRHCFCPNLLAFTALALPCVCRGDVPLHRTISRAWGVLSFRQKLKFAWTLLRDVLTIEAGEWLYLGV